MFCLIWTCNSNQGSISMGIIIIEIELIKSSYGCKYWFSKLMLSIDTKSFKWCKKSPCWLSNLMGLGSVGWGVWLCGWGGGVVVWRGWMESKLGWRIAWPKWIRPGEGHNELPTKFYLKTVNDLFVNAQKLFDQYEVRQWREFSGTWPMSWPTKAEPIHNLLKVL